MIRIRREVAARPSDHVGDACVSPGSKHDQVLRRYGFEPVHRDALTAIWGMPRDEAPLSKDESRGASFTVPELRIFIRATSGPVHAHQESIERTERPCLVLKSPRMDRL